MKEKLNVLLLGNGGRESAIAWKLLQSPRLNQLYVAPGNGSPYGTTVKLDISDFKAIETWAAENSIDMIVVGPEQPLVDGITDYFKNSNIKVIGPNAEGAQLEGSKEFAKEFMFRHAVPTARFMTVTHDTLEEGNNFLQALKPPYVLKADGLAAGKGVIICQSLADAKDTLADMLNGMFGNASNTVVIEEFMHGIECSVFVLTDGNSYKILPVAKDYKRVGENDEGPNTGGMGSVSPVPFADDEFMEKVEKRIVIPTLNGLKEENIEYRGFLFVGLMNVAGDPMVVEYNVRMGDPETEVVMPRLDADLLDLLEGVAEQTLQSKEMAVDARAAVAVMIVAGGYPGKYEKGKTIHGLNNVDDAIIFHAGTKRNENNEIVTNGGRVLAIAAYGNDIKDAANHAFEQVAKVSFDDAYYRRDIAADLMK
jgi:phosphoribosylamine--glycine ligase